jgi:hypothetical protein
MRSAKAGGGVAPWSCRACPREAGRGLAWSDDYLLNEATTPQAWYGARKSFRRIKGSIPLGELGGDRVVLSKDLKDTLLRAGKIEPYRRTYANRQPRVDTQPVIQPVELSRAA